MTALNADEFWTRVDRSSAEGCWPWTGTVHFYGYGSLTMNRQTLIAHRVAFTLSGGTLEGRHDLHHRCENKLCCRPDHLLPLTHVDHLRLHARLRREKGFISVAEAKRRDAAERKVARAKSTRRTPTVTRPPKVRRPRPVYLWRFTLRRPASETQPAAQFTVIGCTDRHHAGLCAYKWQRFYPDFTRMQIERYAVEQPQPSEAQVAA